MTVAEDRSVQRLGIFGGTFDPLHTGHLAAAQDVLETLELDRLAFVPAARPPHKDAGRLSPASARLRMAQAVVQDDPRFEALDLELRRGGVSYTVDTLRELRTSQPGTQLFLLLGADQWADFGSWREPREIARLAQLVLMARAGERPADIDAGFRDGAPPEFIEVPVTRLDISSTRLRERAGSGRSIRYLVPESVRRIIEADALYLSKP